MFILTFASMMHLLEEFLYIDFLVAVEAQHRTSHLGSFGRYPRTTEVERYAPEKNIT